MSFLGLVLQAKTFAKNMVNHLEVAQNLVRIGLIVYSSRPRIVFNFFEHETKQEVLNVLRTAKKDGGTTDTASALDLAQHELFKTINGHR